MNAAKTSIIILGGLVSILAAIGTLLLIILFQGVHSHVFQVFIFGWIVFPPVTYILFFLSGFKVGKKRSKEKIIPQAFSLLLIPSLNSIAILLWLSYGHVGEGAMIGLAVPPIYLGLVIIVMAGLNLGRKNSLKD